MSLLVQCHQCGKVLELDDGFRGGVCRCRQCGTLLRVPMTDTHQVQKSRPAEPAAAKPKPASGNAAEGQNRDQASSGFPASRPESPDLSSSRQLRPEPPGAIAGSGAMRPARPESPLSENLSQRSHRSREADVGASNKSHRTPPASGQSAPGNYAKSHLNDGNSARRYRKWANLPVGVYAALVAVLLLIVVVVIVLAIGVLAGRQSPRQATHTPAPVPAPASRTRFLGIPIRGKSVVFSLDGSSANSESFNLLASLVGKAVQSLPATMRIKFAIWKPTGLQVFPANGWLSTRTTPIALRKLLAYSPYGSTSITKMMLDTLKLGAEQNIFTTQKIIVPGKLAAAVGAAAGPGQRIDILSINGEERILKKIAQSTGGQFRLMSLSSLQSAISQ